MLLGGFGKSWRRADHRKFRLNKTIYDKHLIGCHWEWANPDDNPVHNSNEAVGIIRDTLIAAQEWMKNRGYSEAKPLTNPGSQQLISVAERQKLRGLVLKSANAKQSGQAATGEWREAWRTDNVQVWVRSAKNEDDSKVIPWLHYEQPGTTKQDRGRDRASSSRSQVDVSKALVRPANQGHSRPSIYRTK